MRHFKSTTLTLALIIIIGAFLRFYKLDWAEGLFTHPDEYHITGSVNQLSFPNQMHPHFFSYGTVTIYLIYFTQELIRGIASIFNFQFSIFNSFLIGRFYSALFSTLTIFLVYKICTAFFAKKQFSLIAAFWVAITPGLIQQAHFATPESAQIFFLFSSLLFMIKFSKQNKFLYLVLASLFLGFSLGVKISSIVFLLPLIATIAFRVFSKHHLRGAPTERGHLGGGEGIRPSTPPRWAMKKTKLILRLLLRFTGLTLTSAIVTSATFAIVAPFVFIDFPSFKSNLDYEGGLAIGKIPVFYTRQFIDTIPILFQLEKILPYALGPAILVFGVLGFFLIVFKHLGWWQADPEQSRRRSHDSSEMDVHGKLMLLIFVAFLSLFIPNAFLFAKWTRFITPSFPFFAIFAAISLQTFAKKIRRSVYYFLGGVLVSGTVLWTMSFFSIYINRDIRITASLWLEMYAKPGSSFLVEGGNTIDIPLNGSFQRTSLDFYALEENPSTREQIVNALYSSDYFLIQSRRVFYNHQRLRHLYPKTSHFYDSLFDGKMGFEQIKTFYSYPKLSFLGLSIEFPDETAEETWSVFDHPVIRVFKKKMQLNREDYARLMNFNP